MTRRHCPEAPFIFTSTNKVYGDTPNRLPLVELDTRWSVDEAHPFSRHGIDEIDEHRQQHAQRVRRLEGRGRRHGAGIRALLRPEDGVFPRRLPDRPRPLRRRAPRLSVVSREVRGDRPAVHGVRLQGQAGPRQHPLPRSRAARSGTSTARPESARSTTLAVDPSRTARCSKPLRSSSA